MGADAQAGRGQVAGNAADTGTVGPVRGQGDVDDRIAKAKQVGQRCADGRVARALDIGHVDDAVMLV